jgi:putative oxidoreductase
MKKLLSTSYSDTAFNISTFVVRVTFGFLMFFNHGINKIKGFSEAAGRFYDPFHIGHETSLILVVFAEVFCALFVVLGLFTRLAAAVLVIEMLVAVFLFHRGQSISSHELGIVYLVAFFGVLCIGPGKYSVDGAMGK